MGHGYKFHKSSIYKLFNLKNIVWRIIVYDSNNAQADLSELRFVGLKDDRILNKLCHSCISGLKDDDLDGILQSFRLN